MSSNKGCGRPSIVHTSGLWNGILSARTSAAEIHHLSQGFNTTSVGASENSRWVVDSRNHKVPGIGNSRQWASETTPKAWGQPDQSQRLGLHGVNSPSIHQAEETMSTDDDEDDDEDFYSDDDDDLLSDDLDGSDVSSKISTRHKMLRKFFKLLDKLTIEEMNDPSREWHCPACQGGPGAINWYRGLQALMLHAKTKVSKRVKLHRKFADLLNEELQLRGTNLIPSADLVGQWEGPKQEVKSQEIVWPPMVIVMNTLLAKDDTDKWAGMGSEELLLNFGEYGALKAKHSYGPQGHRGMSVLIFDSSAKGYIEAQQLDEHFLKQGRGRTAWNHGPVLFCSGGKRRLFGFMAVKEDLDIFNRHNNGKSRLKFEMRAYEDMVIKQVAQMSEDSELLIWYKKRAAKAEQRAKVSEEAWNFTSQKLRRVLDDTRNNREKSKMQLQENKEEMDYLAQLVGKKFQEIRKVTAPIVESVEKIQEEADKNELFNSNGSSTVNHMHWMEEMIQSLVLNTEDRQSFDAEKLELVKICQNKMIELEQKYQEAKSEVARELDAAVSKLIERYTTCCPDGSAAGHV